MCGIAGLFSSSPASDAAVSKFAHVWDYQELRGHDACGVLAVGVVGGKRHIYYSKFPVTCSKFVPYTIDVWRRHGFRPMYAIAHARAATHGPPEVNANNHPIVHVRDGLFAIVHNGVLSMNGICASKVSQTDTEELLCLIENTIKSGGELKEAYDKIRGSATFIAMQIDQSLDLKRFIVGKYINPLDRIEVDGGAMILGSVIPTHVAPSTTVRPGIYELVSGYRYESQENYYDYYRYFTAYYTYKPNDKEPAPPIADDGDRVDAGICFEECLMSVAEEFCDDYDIREVSPNDTYELTCKDGGKSATMTARVADRRIVDSKAMTKGKAMTKELRRCINKCAYYRLVEAV
jgi:asparagine synthetase B (glutamine-hydrolysing)